MRAGVALRARSTSADAAPLRVLRSDALQLPSPVGARQMRGNSGRLAPADLADEIEIEVRSKRCALASADPANPGARGIGSGCRRSRPHPCGCVAHEGKLRCRAAAAAGGTQRSLSAHAWRLHAAGVSAQRRDSAAGSAARCGFAPHRTRHCACRGLEACRQGAAPGLKAEHPSRLHPAGGHMRGCRRRERHHLLFCASLNLVRAAARQRSRQTTAPVARQRCSGARQRASGL